MREYTLRDLQQMYEEVDREIDEDEARGYDGVIRVASVSANPKDLIGQRKAPIHLIPAPALILTSLVMSLGAAKYGPYNWREHPVKLTVYLDAAWRHLMSCLDGEWIDPESGQPHVAHAICCCAILLDAKATGNLVDDRPKPGCAAKLIEETTKKEPGANTGVSYRQAAGVTVPVDAFNPPMGG